MNEVRYGIVPQASGRAETANVGQNHAGRQCESCGEDALCEPPLFTTINKIGPLCVGCYADEEDQEQEANSQFGVGA